MKHAISLWIEDTSTGETSYKDIEVTCNPLVLEDEIQRQIDKLPSGIRCDGWNPA
jgi:hypothetical protein